MSDKVVLCVGLVCVDIVSVCDGFPKEDTDQRSLEQQWRRGGNASNSSTVMSLLGTPCALIATLAVSHELHFLKENLDHYGIAYDQCVYHPGCQTPMSLVIINKQNGSRTIIHSNMNLPELSPEEFVSKVDLSSGKYKWIHFEGRKSLDSIKEMLEVINKHNASLQTDHEAIVTSVELEKNIPKLDELCSLVDYVFVSKDHASNAGYNCKENAVEGFIKKCRQRATVICPWGDLGAAAKTHGSPTVTSCSYPPDKLVDTLGAGDTFIAATISSLSTGHELQEAIEFGCKVAGAKCGMNGFDGLKSRFSVK